VASLELELYRTNTPIYRQTLSSCLESFNGWKGRSLKFVFSFKVQGLNGLDLFVSFWGNAKKKIKNWSADFIQQNLSIFSEV